MNIKISRKAYNAECIRQEQSVLEAVKRGSI